MYLNVAVDFSENFIEKVAEYEEVKVLFGKMPSDYIGGGIDTSLLKNISYDYFFAYIEKAKKNGILFNYIINAPTNRNNEFSEKGKRKINELLSILNELELESVTVSNPFLLLYIKHNFKNLRIKASANFNIDSVEKARKVKNMGADILVLDPMLVNRDFSTLKKIRKEIGEELEIIVNNNCLMTCPMLNYHQNYLGLLEPSDSDKKDFCYQLCSAERIKNPINYIKSDIIRPEDLHYYEELGFERFKIIDRCTPPDLMLKRVKAYIEHRYNGNLLDIIQHFGYKDSISSKEYIRNIYIDNNALDGFMEQFVSEKCNGRNCSSKCKYCDEYAKKSILIDNDFYKNNSSNKERDISYMLK